MKHCEDEWRLSALHDNESGESKGEIPFGDDKSRAWDQKMVALEEIHVEISEQMVAIQTALDDNTTSFDSDWQESKGGGYEEYRQAQAC